MKTGMEVLLKNITPKLWSWQTERMELPGEGHDVLLKSLVNHSHVQQAPELNGHFRRQAQNVDRKLQKLSISQDRIYGLAL